MIRYMIEHVYGHGNAFKRIKCVLLGVFLNTIVFLFEVSLHTHIRFGHMILKSFLHHLFLRYYMGMSEEYLSLHVKR